MTASVTMPVPASRAPRDLSQSWSAERGPLIGLALAAPLIVLVVVMLLYPLGKLISIAFDDGDGFGSITAFFSSAAHIRTMRLTFVDSAIVTLVCVTVGSVVAWALHTTASRLTKAVLWASIILPFLMGSVIKLYALVVLLERHGVINRALMGIGITDSPTRLLYNQFAVVLGLTYHMLPFAVLPLLAGFQTISPDLVKAAESLGASRAYALFSTVLPLSLPSMLATGTIVYIICLGFYLTPEVLGGPTTPFSSSLIAQDVFQFYDLKSASVSALVLLVGSLVVVLLAYALVGRERLARAVAA
ncbi:MAG: ABC transporter permease [Mesorhizobium sp.]|nr:ABC transporter permease [Mesorhizobium sp.]MBN9243234.1 ABC transporter permease [Mesorhizobium sp.]